MKRFGFILILLSALQPLAAQQSRPRKTNPSASKALGTVTGQVSAASQGGKINPAREATVYFFAPDIAQLYSSLLDASQPLGRAECKASLAGVDLALIHTKKIATEERRRSFPEAQTDEQGRFRATGLAPGPYLIIVRGQAGAEDAYWLSNVSAEAGKTSAVKLLSPLQACRD